jgi:diacylglycerol kinase family enzyme
MSAGRRALLVVNPNASSLRSQGAERVAAALAPVFALSVVRTEARGHATIIAREAARAGVEVVAVLGGDGTVSEAADGLAGSPTVLVPLPAGVTNVFARSLGGPADAASAAGGLAARAGTGGHGRGQGPALPARAVDLGTVNGRHFLFSSGVGLSAAIMAEAEAAPERKASLGQLHFTAAAVSVLARRYLRDPPRLRLEAGGRTVEGITVVVQNAEMLTYFGPRRIRVCVAAGLQTGSLSLTLLRSARVRDVPAVLPRIVSGRAEAVVAHPLVEGFPGVAAATIVATDGVAMPVEADGEYLGEHLRVGYGAAPGALQVVDWGEPSRRRAQRAERMIRGSLAARAGRSRRDR